EAHGAVIGLDDQLEREEGATGALGLNERGERHHEVVRWLEAQAVAVGQRAAVAAVTAQQLEHLVAPLAELGSRECAGDRRLRRGRPMLTLRPLRRSPSGGASGPRARR